MFALHVLFLASIASGLAQYGLVSHLFSVLMSPHLEPEDRLSVLLTLSHCTEASGKSGTSCGLRSTFLPLMFVFSILHALSSPAVLSRFSFPSSKKISHIFFLCAEAHQSQLVQSGGLPLIITLLTEDTSEEVRKAATFILQTCKQASKSERSCRCSDDRISFIQDRNFVDK